MAASKEGSPERFATKLANLIGLNSLRGRYSCMVLLFALIMVTTAWIADKQVNKATEHGITTIAGKQAIQQTLLSIRDNVQAVTNNTQNPNDQRRAMQDRLEQALAQATALTRNAWVNKTPAAAHDVQHLVEYLTQLRSEFTRSAGGKPDTAKPSFSPRAQPLVDHINKTLMVLESEANTYTTEDMLALNQTLDYLLHSLWFLVLIGILVTASGILIFEYAIRKPITNITRAFKAEAEGITDVAVPDTHTLETHNLVSAFDYLRRQVHTRQLRLETILDNAAEGIITFDADGVIESFNQAAERLFGYAEEEVVGKDLTVIIPPHTRETRQDYLKHFIRTEIQHLIGHEGEVTGRHKDGATFPMALKISAMMLDGKKLYTGLVADISERKAMLEHLKNMAEHDGLTGLFNRSYFQQELERVVERVKRSGGMCCSVMYLDLDNFKYVNDTLGHAAGDRLIIEVAQILQKRARKSDLIARFGGDEFTVLLFDTTPMLANKIAESFRTKIAEYTFRHSGEQVDIGCSIGVTTISPQTPTAIAVLSQADLACHLAKRGGRNRVHMFNASDAESVTAMTLDMGWSRRIKEAIEKNLFTLACQPIIDTRTRVIESYEVLIRMVDERRELIMPSGFLSSAERFGLSADIDKWVITHAIHALAQQQETCPNLRYAINLSGGTLTTPGICELVEAALKETGVDPQALTFEVTETVAIADMAAAEMFLSRLQSMGCQTALDDFGSGMASFAYLKDLPVNCVKIDGRFVKNMASSPVDQAMVKAMNEIAHALGKKTIAEFVENEESYKLLVEYGVDYAQGYHLGRPDITLPCEAIARIAGNIKSCKK